MPSLKINIQKLLPMYVTPCYLCLWVEHEGGVASRRKEDGRGG